VATFFLSKTLKRWGEGLLKEKMLFNQRLKRQILPI
jgi:hypothetical protein